MVWTIINSWKCKMRILMMKFTIKGSRDFETYCRIFKTRIFSPAKPYILKSTLSIIPSKYMKKTRPKWIHQHRAYITYITEPTLMRNKITTHCGQNNKWTFEKHGNPWNYELANLFHVYFLWLSSYGITDINT